jgi:hypothetical protein
MHGDCGLPTCSATSIQSCLVIAALTGICEWISTPFTDDQMEVVNTSVVTKCSLAKISYAYILFIKRV